MGLGGSTECSSRIYHLLSISSLETWSLPPKEGWFLHCPFLGIQAYPQSLCRANGGQVPQLEDRQVEGPITATISAPLISGTSSLLWIVCFILGALLFLALILLGIQMYRGRIQQQAFSRYRDSLYETVHQEIDYYLTRDKNNLLSSPDISSCSDDSPGDEYDDAEEFSRPEIPHVSQMNEGSALGTTDEWNEQKESNISVGPEIGGSSDSNMGEDAPPMSSEDLGYDKAEIGVPQISL